jgi:predicted Zn finger-like uncharacterized protein
MTHMEVSCSGCQKVYNIPNKKIPAKGAKVKCKDCDSIVVIPPPENKAEKINATLSNEIHKTVTSSEKKQTYSADNRIAEKLKKVTISASSKGEEVKQLAIKGLNQLEKSKRMSLIIVVSTFIFFLFASILKNVFLFGALFERLTSIFFLLFFIFMVLGFIKGVKNNIVVFYDSKDMLNSFKIIGSLIVVFFGFSIVVSTVIGPELFDTSLIKLLWFISCVSVPSYFLYLSISATLQHNNNESVVNLISAICAKVGAGILYPVVIIHELSQIGTHDIKDSSGNAVGTRTHSALFLVIFMAVGGALIYKLVNGEAVYKKRNLSD